MVSASAPRIIHPNLKHNCEQQLYRFYLEIDDEIIITIDQLF